MTLMVKRDSQQEKESVGYLLLQLRIHTWQKPVTEMAKTIVPQRQKLE